MCRKVVGNRSVPGELCGRSLCIYSIRENAPPNLVPPFLFLNIYRCILVQLLITAAPRVPGLGRLPGDLVVQRDSFTLFAPCGTMIVVSIILTVVINVI